VPELLGDCLRIQLLLYGFLKRGEELQDGIHCSVVVANKVLIEPVTTEQEWS
jgi:hypothetical protein